jgi:integrase/recombinase XerD
MSNDYNKTAAELRRERFDLETDPLKKLDPVLREINEIDAQKPPEEQEGDELQQYIDKIQRRALEHAEGTIYNYELTFRDWREYMYGEHDRHPACPNKEHVLGFIDLMRETNKPSTTGKIISRLHEAYKWWQVSDDFKYDLDYDPFEAALMERNLKDTKEEHKTKSPPYVTLDDVREVVHGIKHIADRAIVGLQLKLGCRSGELANIRISEIRLSHEFIGESYPMLGSHRRLREYPDAILIPHNRKGNKRERSTVIPLDEEARKLLIGWLLVRPDVPDPDHPDDPRLFMTHKGKPLAVNDIHYIWSKYWWPEYEQPEDGQYRSITPSFARHRFSTYWQSDLTGINREYVKYLRGDVTEAGLGKSPDALDHYIHTFYEDVEEVYRNRMYDLYI